MKCKKGIIIEARTSSVRLPKKTLKKICGKPTIQLLIERVKKVSDVDVVILATTHKKCDDKLIEIAKKEKIKSFRGSEDDVLGRVLGAAKKFKVDQIISVQGDCTLIDPGCIERVIRLFNNTNHDYASSALLRTYPVGMETQVFWTRILSKVDKLTNLADDREHVTQYIYKNPKIFNILKVKAPAKHKRPNYFLVLDEPDDLRLIKIIYKEFYHKNKNFSIDDIIDFLDKNPGIARINKNLERNKESLGIL